MAAWCISGTTINLKQGLKTIYLFKSRLKVLKIQRLRQDKTNKDFYCFSYFGCSGTLYKF